MHTKDLMHSINNTNDKMTNNNPLILYVPFHPGQVYRPPPKPIKKDISYPQRSWSSPDIENINPNFDFEENSPFQGGITFKTFQRSDKSFFQEPRELGNLINKENLIHKYLPKQMDIDKMLEVIQRKVLKGSFCQSKSKKYRQDIYIVHILKICTCIYHKTNCLLLRQH